MNVAIYARVSTEQQAEKGYSISTQIEACQKKAMELGADTIKVYKDDGYSGAYLERPALDSLRDALAAGLHDTVIVYDTDRLARDTMVLLLNMAGCSKALMKHYGEICREAILFRCFI